MKNTTYTMTPMLTSLVPNMAALYANGSKAEDRRVTPQQARDMLEAWGTYTGQRKMNRDRVNSYGKMMEAGKWKYFSEIHVGVLPDGQCKLLNGYHRLIALSKIEDEGYTLPITVIFRLMADNQDLADYYGVMDTGKTRTATDAIRAQRLAEEWGVAIDTLRSAGAAAATITTDFRGNRALAWKSSIGRSNPARIEFLREWEGEIKSADALIKTAPVNIRKLILRQPVMAVMLQTLRHVPDRADEFWYSVITGEALLSGMPAMTLRNYLITTPIKGINEHVYARYVSNCWNGFYRGASMTRVQVKMDGLGDMIVIDGTPYSRGRRDRERLQRIEAEKQRAANARKPKQEQAPDSEPEAEPVTGAPFDFLNS
jgi:hypothetical protein